MRDSMREHGGSALDAATKRLERALSALETRSDRRLKRIEAMEAGRGGGDSDRAQLVAELEAARARERALESIAAEASAALGRAAEEVRAALSEPAVKHEASAAAGEPDLEPTSDGGSDPDAPEDEIETAIAVPPIDAPEDEDGAELFIPQAAQG